VSDRPGVDEPSRILLLHLKGREKTRFTDPPPDSKGDFLPIFSPDGTALAFVRQASRGFGDRDVWVQPTEGREARPLTRGHYDWCCELAWSPDGKEVVFSTGSTGASGGRMYRVGIDGTSPRPVAGIGQPVGAPTIQKQRMVYVQFRLGTKQDILRLPLGEDLATGTVPERFISSSEVDLEARYSPDGQRIALQSSRSGPWGIWVSGADGRDALLLTSKERGVGSPRWSPDSRKILFDSPDAGSWDLYLIDAEGGEPERLTEEPSEDNTGTFSRDGRWIYFHSDRSGESQVWKMPASGGEAVQLTRDGGQSGWESWDGRHFYYSKSSDGPTVWRVPVDGGEEEEVLRGPSSGSLWALSASGIYYATTRTVVPERRLEYTINHYDLVSGQVTRIFATEGSVIPYFLEVAPDEDWIIFMGYPMPESELMLVENFH